jgi:hypothetical protein
MARFRLSSLSTLALLGATALSAQQIEKRLPSGVRRDTATTKTEFGTISGAVSDTNLVPLEGAEVNILRTNVRVHTLANGRFQILKVPAGHYMMITRRLGFRPVTAIVEVPASDTLRISYTLERVPQGLDTVVISERRQSARMMEFEDRKRLGQGEFMSADDIAKRASIFTPDLFRAFKTVDISPVNGAQHGGFPEYVAMSRRGVGSIMGPGAGACPMQVFVDGVPMPSGFDMALLPPPSDFAGVEVYAGAATAPMQYATNDTRCGLILIWTKDR